MATPSRVEQLQNLGVIKDDASLSANAKALIENMTDDEFHAVVTARAKISDGGHRDDYDQAIQMHGF
ncbi:MAG: hypothetical protein KDK04_28305 [Candidatus Competibacteraceae bacterium]|nr:hypothetical protein [Candidatus Competibacteraceae bacterium]MCB1815590.1 hypothetical protein [Candidatus Competibacteraceae bacterium]